MNRPKIFVTRKIGDEALRKLAEQAEVDLWDKDSPPPHDVLVSKAAQVDGMITLLSDPIDRPVMDAFRPEFKVLSQMAVGFDNIDIARATERGIPVGHTPGVLTECCADFTWALLLAASRRVVEAHNEVQQGIWRPWGPDVLVGQEVNGASLGIVGFGRIGQAVARRARGFNMTILYHDLHRNQELEKEYGAVYLSLEELLKQSDFISIHTTLNQATHHLISREQFKWMKPTAILVNISRGGVVDPDALTWALQNKLISGAALDVFEPEPIPRDSPLLTMKNVVIVPHIASAGGETRRKMSLIAVVNLLAGLRDEPLLHCANPEVYNRRK